MGDVVAKPGRFAVYKKSAAAQINLILPSYNDKGWMDRNGAVMIEATKATGVDGDGNIQYDWSQGTKITFSLGMNDLALLFNDFEAKLVHEYQGSVKGLQFKPGTGNFAGTYQLLLNQKDADGTTRNMMVPFSGGEVAVFSRLLDSATPKLLGW